MGFFKNLIYFFVANRPDGLEDGGKNITAPEAEPVP